MNAPLSLDLHCSSDKQHALLLQRHSKDILKLSDEHKVRVFSRTETIQPDSSQHRIVNNQEDLEVQKIYKYLNTQWLGCILTNVPWTPSTQNILKEGMMGWSGNGWVTISGKQTKGRGRRGTVWISPMGSVAISIALTVRVEQAERLTLMQYLAGLAGVEAVKRPEWGGMRLQVKWPNDIYLNGQKVGGVLCEARSRGDVFKVVLGIGMNVTNDRPTACLVPGGTGELREMFIGHFLNSFEKLYDEFCERGFDGRLKERYIDAWMHTNQKVRIGGEKGPVAFVKGLASNGWVRVFREDLQAFQDICPENTSLDVHENVIREKIGECKKQL